MKALKRKLISIFVLMFCIIQLNVITFAMENISLNSSVSGVFNLGNSLHEYSLVLDNPTSVGFYMFGQSSQSPTDIEWIVSIQSLDGYFSEYYHNSDEKIARTVEYHQGEAAWEKASEIMPAGNYTVTISAPEYIFANEFDGEMTPNGLEITYSFELFGQVQGSPQASTNDRTPQLIIDMNNGIYTAFGTQVKLSSGTPKPFIDSKGNTMIPIRFLEDLAFVGFVEWSPQNKQIKIDNLDRSIVLTVNSSTAYINGKAETLYDASGRLTAPYMYGGRAYLPLRAMFVTALGIPSPNIEYNNKIITVY